MTIVEKISKKIGGNGEGEFSPKMNEAGVREYFEKIHGKGYWENIKGSGYWSYLEEHTETDEW